jgi:pimeloyl-[acyl-carrier protein] methyl ester esterase
MHSPLNVEISGSGPDLALLHGWGIHSGVWDSVRDDLAQHFRVHVVDLPGYGASAACAPYNLEAVARQVLAALPQRVHVAGWSLGGQVALQMTLLAPARIEKLVLIGTTPCFRVRNDWPHGMSDAALAEFSQGIKQDYEGTLKRFLSLQARSGDEARAVIGRLRETLFARGRPTHETLRAGLQILSDLDLRNELSAITHPALIIHGSHDTLARFAAGAWLAQALPNAALELIPGAAHAPFLSHPQQTLNSIKRFLHG